MPAAARASCWAAQRVRPSKTARSDREASTCISAAARPPVSPGDSAFFTHSHKIKRSSNAPLTLKATATGSNADAAGLPIPQLEGETDEIHTRASRCRGRRSILVGVGLKLIFFAAPTAEADSRPIKSARVDISQIHQNIKSLPVQKSHDMSLVFPVID